MGSTPAKHRVDGKWTGHKHKTLLGKLSGVAASKGEMNVGGDFAESPGSYTGMTRDIMWREKKKKENEKGLFKGSRISAQRQKSDGEYKGMKLGGELKIGGKSIIETSAPRPEETHKHSDGAGGSYEKTHPARGRTWKIFGHDVGPSSDDYKKNKKAGESRYQYNIRKKKSK